MARVAAIIALEEFENTLKILGGKVVTSKKNGCSMNSMTLKLLESLENFSQESFIQESESALWRKLSVSWYASCKRKHED